MEQGATVDMFTVVLAIRLSDMQNICKALVQQCEERGRPKLARRFSRAAVSFGDMLKELEANERQQSIV